MHPLQQKIDALKKAYRKARRKLRTIGNLIARGYPRHASAKRKTTTKHTQRNKWNIRPSRSRRPEARFIRLRVFKQAYGIK